MADPQLAATAPPDAGSNAQEEVENKNFRVAVRVRPLNQREKNSDAHSAWKIKKNVISSTENRGVNLHFDNLFTEKSTTADVYETMAKDVVASAMEGIHGTVFAYGQTSSGKTHTMMGDNDHPGVIPLAVQDIFSCVRKTFDREFIIRVSYLEIYQECVRDLFKPDDTDLRLHEHPEHGFYVKATEIMVSKEEEILQLMDSGEAHRHVGQTNMNEKSSRSHTIFRITIESKVEIEDDTLPAAQADVEEEEDEENSAGLCIRAATLNLVDLAGSERVGDTGAEGVRLKEAGNINQSLLTLGTVIKKLSEGNGQHIPYRDSKLTKILQPSLGGNGKTSMICAVTPANSFVDETRSTLLFADRAKNVKNSAKVNVVMDDKALLLQSKKEIAALQKQLQMMQNGTVSPGEIDVLLQQKKNIEEDNQALQRKIAEHTSEKEILSSKLSHVSALLMGGSVATVTASARRASNPAIGQRRVTFGNYTHRAETQRRCSVLDNLTVKSVDNVQHHSGAFGNLTKFSDYQPMAKWDEDEDRDLGVLEEYEEEDEDDSSGPNENTTYEHDKKIEELQVQLSQSERIVAELQQKLETADSSTQDCARLQADIIELREENEAKAREIEHIETEYSQIVSDAQTLRNQLTESKEAIEAAKAQSEQLREMQATLAEYKIKLSRAESSEQAEVNGKQLQEHEAAAATIDKLERDRYDLKLQSKETAAKLKTAQAEAERLRIQLETSHHELASVRKIAAQNEQEASRRIAQADENAHRQKEKIVFVETSLADMRSQLENSQSSNQILEAEKLKTGEALATANSHVRSLTDNLAEAREQNVAARRELKEQQVLRKQLEARVDSRAAENGLAKLNSLESKFKNLLKEKAVVEKEKAAAQRDARDLKKEKDMLEKTLNRNDNTTKVKNLKEQVNDLQTRLRESEREGTELRKHLLSAETQCAEVLTAMDELTQQLSDLRSEKDSIESNIDLLSDQLASARVSTTELTHNFNLVTAENIELQSKIDTLQCRCDSLEEQARLTQVTLAEKERSLATSKQMQTELEQAQRWAEEAQENSAAALAEVSAKLAEAENMLRSESQVVANHEHTIAGLQAQNKNLETQQLETLKAADLRCDQLEAQNKELTSENHTVHEQLTETRMELSTIKEDHMRMASEVRSLEEAANTACSHAEELEKRCTALTNTKQGLADQLSKVVSEAQSVEETTTAALDKMTQQVAQLEHEKEGLADSLESLRAQCKELNDTIALHETQRADFEAAKSKSHEEKQSLENELTAILTQKQNLEAQRKEIEDIASEACERAEDLQGQCKTLTDEKAELMEELSMIVTQQEQQLEQARAEKLQLEMQTGADAAIVNELRHARSKALETEAMSRRQVERLTAELTKIDENQKEIAKEQANQIAELEDDKMRLEDMIAVKEKMVADERLQREMLETKLQKICSKAKRTPMANINGMKRALAQ